MEIDVEDAELAAETAVVVRDDGEAASVLDDLGQLGPTRDMVQTRCLATVDGDVATGRIRRLDRLQILGGLRAQRDDAASQHRH